MPGMQGVLMTHEERELVAKRLEAIEANLPSRDKPERKDLQDLITVVSAALTVATRPGSPLDSAMRRFAEGAT